MLSAEEGASESAEAINEQSTSNQDRRGLEAIVAANLHMRSRIISVNLSQSQHAIGTQSESSSDKCLIVISQRCRSPRTASDSSSSCLHMKQEAIMMQSRGSHRCAISHPSLSSDKCLVVISQRCRSPRTASDSSSSCLHMKRPMLDDYSPPGQQRPSAALSGHQRPSAAIRRAPADRTGGDPSPCPSEHPA